MGLSKRQMNLGLIMASGVLVLAFQNCGQMGSIDVSEPSLSKASVATDIPQDGGGDGPVVTIPDIPKDPIDEPKPPVVQTPDIPKDPRLPPVINGDDKHHECDESENESDHDKDHDRDHDRDHGKDNDKELDEPSRCGNVSIVSFHLSIDVIGNSNRGDLAVLLPDQDIVLIPGLNRIRLKAAFDDDQLNQIKILLNEDKSYVKTADGKKVSLDMPSAGSSGLKFNLISKASIKEGQFYELEVEVKIDAVLIGSGKNAACKFAPLIREAKLLN